MMLKQVFLMQSCVCRCVRVCYLHLTVHSQLKFTKCTKVCEWKHFEKQLYWPSFSVSLPTIRACRVTVQYTFTLSSTHTSITHFMILRWKQETHRGTLLRQTHLVPRGTATGCVLFSGNALNDSAQVWWCFLRAGSWRCKFNRLRKKFTKMTGTNMCTICFPCEISWISTLINSENFW